MRKLFYAFLLPVVIPALAFGNLVQNPSMEGSFISQPPLGNVAEGWTGWHEGYGLIVTFSEETDAHDGFKSQKIYWAGEGFNVFGPGGIYQQVGSLQVGQLYRALVWFKFYLYALGAEFTCSIGTDPDGGTEPSLVTNWIGTSGYKYPQGGDEWPWFPVILFFSSNGNIATLFVKVSGSGTGGGEMEGEPWPWCTLCYIDDVVVEPIQIGQGSTVEATSPVPADGGSYSEITITILDPNGNPIEGIPPSEIIVNCTGSGNLIDEPYTQTDPNGQTWAWIASTVPETKIVRLFIFLTTGKAM